MENWSRAQRTFLDVRGASLLKLVITTLILLVLLGASARVAWGDEVEDLFGSITVVREPVPAVIIDEGLIPVGETHTYSYRLEKDHTYHIYLSGEWADPEDHTTDYDLYVYEYDAYSSILLSTHTEAAGLLEQVGNDPWGRFFTPDASGLYYIAVKNDVLESFAAEPGTLMVIERIETNIRQERWMEGKINEEPQSTTFWSYEFASSSPRIRVQVDVPDTLDMYEARLYVMANPEAGIGERIKGIPVAWEPGLRGELKGVYGGFNLNQTGFRHVDAMASCERNGEDMIIDYAAPTEGEILYHIALIAEYGIGKIEFIVQTDFDPPNVTIIDPPEIVVALEPTSLDFEVNDLTEVTSLEFFYSLDGWETQRALNPSSTENGALRVTFPLVNPGTTLEYSIETEDKMGNYGETNGSLYAMGASTLEVRFNEGEITAGEEVEIRGRLNLGGEYVNISITNGETNINVTQETGPDGRFNYSFKPSSTGNWTLKASYDGSEAYHPAVTEPVNLTVSSLQTAITCSVDRETIESGKTVTVTGSLDPGKPDVTVEVLVTYGEEQEKIYTKTDSLGRFTGTFQPPTKGEYTVKANVIGDGFLYAESESPSTELTVLNPSLATTLARVPGMLMEKASPLMKPPLLYGIIGAVGLAGGGIVFYLRRRE
jgi:hypothetical protein